MYELYLYTYVANAQRREFSERVLLISCTEEHLNAFYDAKTD